MKLVFSILVATLVACATQAGAVPSVESSLRTIGTKCLSSYTVKEKVKNIKAICICIERKTKVLVNSEDTSFQKQVLGMFADMYLKKDITKVADNLEGAYVFLERFDEIRDSCKRNPKK